MTEITTPLTITEVFSKIQGGLPVFVYGTLKSQFHNHRFLQAERFIAQGITLDKYLLYKSWSLPYVSNREGCLTHGSRIKGEVYSVRNISAIDTLEGAPHHYHSRQVLIQIGTTDVNVPCRMYFDTDERLDLNLDDCTFTDEWTEEFSQDQTNDINYIGKGI